MTDLTSDNESTDEQLHELRRFAALSGRFDPREALNTVAESTRADPSRLVELASALASACDTARGAWLMRAPERRWELRVMTSHESINAVVAWRRAAGTIGEDTGDLLDALVGRGLFTRASVLQRLAGGSPRRVLERLASALDRAGSLAPAWNTVDAVRGALSRLESEERRSRIAAGFVGRRAELATIRNWLAAPSTTRLSSALFVGGVPGIGKTTLLAEAVRRAVAENPLWLPVRLDFDRAGLDVRDELGLTLELARQVASGLGEQAHEIREARLEAAGSRVRSLESVKGDGRDQVPIGLVAPLAASGRRVLIVFDTLEVLRGRGETHPPRLFAWVDRLQELGLAPVTLISAGRGDALDGAGERVARRIDLEGLDPADADRVLAALGVPEEAFSTIRDLADGNPLMLRLAATVALEVGPRALTKVGGRAGVTADHLYRFLLSRIPDPTLRRLANPGLVVRRISAEVITEVLGPQLGLGRIAPSRAVELLGELSEQHWLVQDDPQTPGFVTHRPDLRRLLLRLLYASSPATCAKVDRAAADWFARRSEPWCAVESAYHRLQLMRRDPATPPISIEVLRRLDDDTLAELPRNAQDLVRRLRGERTSLARSDARDTDPGLAAQELQSLMGHGDWLESASVYERTLRDVPLDPRSLEADVVRALLWRTGRWQEAGRLLDERDRTGGDDHTLLDAPAHVAAPHVEMRAELSFAALFRSLQAPESALSAIVARVTHRGLQSELSDGALGFAVERADLRSTAIGTAGVHPAAAASTVWLHGRPDEAEQALSAARDLLTTQVTWQLPGRIADDGTAALLLAVLTPYAQVAATSSRVGRLGEAIAHARAVDRNLALLHGPSAVLAGDRLTVQEPAGDPFVAITALGLFAEWAGAAAFRLRDPDLQLLARRAERWRRTTAGQWSYGDLPAIWRAWRRTVDVTITDRVRRLLASGDPHQEALAQLAAWSGEDVDGPRLHTEIEQRLTGSMRQAQAVADEGHEAVAAVLLRHWVPSAFVPSLAVLISQRRP